MFYNNYLQAYVWAFWCVHVYRKCICRIVTSTEWNSLTQCETVFRPLYLAGQIRNFAAQQGLGALQHLEVMRCSSEALLVGAAGLNEGRHEHGHDDNCLATREKREMNKRCTFVSVSALEYAVAVATCGVRN